MYKENMDESGLDYIYICMNIIMIYYDCNLPPGKQTWQFSTMFHGIIINNKWGIFHCRTRLLEGRLKDAIEINYINNLEQIEHHRFRGNHTTSSNPTWTLVLLLPPSSGPGAVEDHNGGVQQGHLIHCCRIFCE